MPSGFCDRAVLDSGEKGFVTIDLFAQEVMSKPRTHVLSSLPLVLPAARAPSLSPLSFPPFLPRLPKELIYFSKYKWTVSHKDAAYVVSYIIC